jgi:hypothetical protein
VKDSFLLLNLEVVNVELNQSVLTNYVFYVCVSHNISEIRMCSLEIIIYKIFFPSSSFRLEKIISVTQSSVLQPFLTYGTS